MKKIFLAILILAFFFHPSIQKLNKMGSIHIKTTPESENKILATFYHFSRPSLIILTPKEIIEYSLLKEKSEFGEKKIFKHNIENLYRDFKNAKMDKSGELFIFSGREFSVLDDRKKFESVRKFNISSVNKKTPDSFNIITFGNMVTFHQYDFK